MAVFTCGVASGKPRRYGITLWTRINPAEYDPAESLLYEVAFDDGFVYPVTSGSVLPADIGAGTDYTVKVDLSGLPINRFLYYRFTYNGETSAVGRCRTLPNYDTAMEELSLLVLADLNYQEGYYNALRAVTQVDYVFLLGDRAYAEQSSFPIVARDYAFPSGGSVCDTLADFRYMYEVGASDPDWQELARQNTIISIWDDHFFANDHYAISGQYNAPQHPHSGDLPYMTELRERAVQAYYEYTPAETDCTFFTFRFGSLAQAFAVDGRGYRAPHPCGELFSQRNYTPGCAQQFAENQRMLGIPQFDWLTDKAASSDTRWQVILNPVLLSRFYLPQPAGEPSPYYARLDSHDGYAYWREQMVKLFAGKNAIWLSGDIHALWVASIYDDFDTQAIRCGVEFVVPPAASRDYGSAFLDTLGGGGVVTEANHQAIIMAVNPHVQHVQAYRNGVLHVTIGKDVCTARYYTADRTNPLDNPVLYATFLVDRNTMEFV